MNADQTTEARTADLPAAANIRPSALEQYWAWWKRGWWFQLLVLIFNLALAVLILPLAFLLSEAPGLFYLAGAAVGLFVTIPFGGWLYDKFSSRTHSSSSSPTG
jgi:hypothetical protein